jgi:formylglycine-generating enzyme required for sulfatase activity
MHGNVAEWCSDYYSPQYPAGEVTDPQGPTAGKARVVRGGSFDFFPASCRAAARSSVQENYPLNRLGFRVVLEEAR